MSITFRHYQDPEDYQLISEFLIRHYQPDNRDGNWIEPAWEYMHHHPALDAGALERIRIWQDNEKVVGEAHFEWKMGEAFFQFHPGYRYLRQAMLDHAERNFMAVTQDGDRKYLRAFINDYDLEFQSLVGEKGYTKDPRANRPMTKFVIQAPFPVIQLPEGFRLLSLADEPDWAKVHRVLWRGFNHEGDPEIGNEVLEMRRSMFDTPKARRDLKIVVAAPDGEFVSICGMFYEPNGKFGYVEPVATDPAYRRMGLGRAAVLEGVRRCGELGATVAYVGSDQEFYLVLGFEVIYVSECWIKYMDE